MSQNDLVISWSREVVWLPGEEAGVADSKVRKCRQKELNYKYSPIAESQKMLIQHYIHQHSQEYLHCHCLHHHCSHEQKWCTFAERDSDGELGGLPLKDSSPTIGL